MSLCMYVLSMTSETILVFVRLLLELSILIVGKMMSWPWLVINYTLYLQAQVVLQGKSRSIIIRELQRTNLDVNLAVNNLLSRDDEEGDDGEDTASESYLPGGLYPVTFDKEMSVCSYFSVFKHSQHAPCYARYAMKTVISGARCKDAQNKRYSGMFWGIRWGIKE